MTPFDNFDSDGLAGADGFDTMDGSEMGAMPLPGGTPGVDGVVGADGTGAPGTHDSEIVLSPEEIAQARQALLGGDASPPSPSESGLPGTPAPTGLPVDGDTQGAAQPAIQEPQPADPATLGQAADGAEGPTKAEAEAEQARASESAETAQLLSNISKMRHDTAMGIIGNMR